MPDENTQETTDNTEDASADDESTTDSPDEGHDDDLGDEPDTFPREVVQQLRQENGRYRQRAQQADDLAHRLHTELVRATGRLADASDIPFDENHLDDPEALTAAIDQLLEHKPHLASRRPIGDVGQGNRGTAAEPFSLLGLLKDRA